MGGLITFVLRSLRRGPATRYSWDGAYCEKRRAGECGEFRVKEITDGILVSHDLRRRWRRHQHPLPFRCPFAHDWVAAQPRLIRCCFDNQKNIKIRMARPA